MSIPKSSKIGVAYVSNGAPHAMQEENHAPKDMEIISKEIPIPAKHFTISKPQNPSINVSGYIRFVNQLA